MSSRGADVDESNKYEQEFTEFLLKRIGNLGGSIQLQHLTGHLSQLSFDLRCAIGTSQADIMGFLKTHNDLFSVQNGIVKLVDSASSKDGGYDSDCSSVEPFSLLPINIKKGKGVIIRIFPEFGFIRIKEPIKTDAYFRASSFGDKNVDLTRSLYVGSMVYFNARKKTSNEKKSKYYATKVWKVDDSDTLNAVVKRSRKNHETGLYDPMILESEGYIQRVFPNLGFIAVKGDESNTVFFYKNRLLKYDNIVDLTKVLSEGDLVEFTAHRSTKQDAKARWEATKVWKKSSKIKEGTFSKSESNHVKETLELDSSSKNRIKEKEMIKNQQGKICPRSKGTVIKFGQNDIADGDGCTYYINGCQVTDISWEFSEGDDIFFDAVKIKSPPGWKAVLVWTGKRPDIILRTCLGDFTEYTDEETDDNFSCVLSNSSNSSSKSMSVKSGNSSSEVKKFQENTLKLSQSKYAEEKLYKDNFGSHESSSHYGSQSSLSSSVLSKSSEKSKKGQKTENSNQKKSSTEKKLSSCWGDSPYFPDVNDQNITTSDSFSCAPEKVSKHENIKNKLEEFPKNKCSDEEEMSKAKDNKFSDSLIIVKDENENRSTYKNKKACIRNFQCLEGSIIKVYSKFAEVKSSKLPNIVSFFWNNFYYREVSVEELDVEDLKQVLRVGDSVHFNYFEIIDDSGQDWQKVSMAWSGSKPKQADEMTANDFIKQNNLAVSIVDEVIVGDNQEKVVSRKFLSAYEDEDPIKLPDEASNEESCTDDELVSAVNNSKASESYSQAVDHSLVLNEIIEILRKDLTLSKFKVDLKSVSEEILNMVLENHKQKEWINELDPKFLQNENCISAVSETSCTNCAKKSRLDSSSQVKTINSAAQTIITGDIIAQNIFTEC